MDHTGRVTGRSVPCVGAVITDGAGRLLLIQRGHDPGRGLWSIPGGRVEDGETDAAALVREVRAEVQKELEALRAQGAIGSALAAEAEVRLAGERYRALADSSTAITESLFGNTMRGFNDYRWSPTAFRRVPTVRVTARWAFSEQVPYAIRQACIIESARIYKMGTSFYADALANADLGRLIMLNGVHPTTKSLLAGLKRIPI
jgi:8-oxo-dGTP pyrophosphatase MutT (NUDIX family)